MDLETGIKLIEKGVIKTVAAQVWADLGAGNGLFTDALSTILKEGIIYAIDKDGESLRSIHQNITKVKVRTLQMDFMTDEIKLEPLDGILMANALHYVSDPLSLLKKMKANLKANGSFILIEYDLLTPNQWVPFPISYKAAINLAKEAGFEFVTKLDETPSVYNRANIYSLLLR